jgi:hypothetical protein
MEPGAVSGSEPCTVRRHLRPGWLLAERTGRNDIPDNDLRTSRNLIAFFN